MNSTEHNGYCIYSKGEKYLLSLGTPTDKQERIYFPCNNLIKIVNDHFSRLNLGTYINTVP